MMVHLLLVIFVQYGLTIEPVETTIHGPFTKARCAELARTESKILPLKEGDDARWQFATCLEIMSIPEPQPITEPWRY